MKTTASSLAALLLWPLLATAQLAVTVSPARATGQKAVVPLAIRNGFAEKIESARAVCFLLDDQGKMVGQSTKWVIGGTQRTEIGSQRSEVGVPAGLAPGTTNNFHFVITSEKPFATTNLTARVTFSRVVLAGGKTVDPAKSVQVVAAGF